MLTDASAIQSVLLRLPGNIWQGRTVIKWGQSLPPSRAISDEIVAAGGDYLEAPVLGSIPEAKAGKLIVMVGGSEQFHRWSGYCKTLAQKCYRLRRSCRCRQIGVESTNCLS